MKTAAIVVLCLLSAPVLARPTTKFMLDGVAGLAVPIADSSYRDSNWPSPKFGLRIGAEIWLSHHVALAPEIDIEGGPLIGRSAVTTGRVRMQPGMRVLLGFGNGHAFFFRALTGVDLLVAGPGSTGGAGSINAGFSFEPGIGMQFHVAPRAVIGFTAGTPVSFHTFGSPTTLTTADFEGVFFVGYRR
jgi:hypothetical protein